MKGIIYIATNLFNGKSYVGQTIASLNRRRNQHLRNAVSDTVNHFHLALMQYGKEAFEWTVLDEFEGTKEEVIHALKVWKAQSPKAIILIISTLMPSTIGSIASKKQNTFQCPMPQAGRAVP